MKIRLRKTLFILPNLFTLSSIFCGFYAAILCADHASNDDFYRASLLILFSMLFDMIDGRVARLTKTQSAFGVQIDSLADVVSFGAVPAILVYQWSLKSLGLLGLIISFAYLACGTIRLARFNVITTSTTGAPKKPGKHIIGLPIPAAAGILISLVVANHAVAGSLPQSSYVVMSVVIALSFFMVSRVKFRSFKDVRLSWRTAILIALAIGSTTFVAFSYHVSFALVWLLACYIAIGLAEAVLSFSRRGQRNQVEDEEANRSSVH